jgi:hypothetical protein
MKFEVGQRVKRLSDPFNESSAMLHGNIVERYSKPGYNELYIVRWDNRQVAWGFLPHGLQESDDAYATGAEGQG